MVGSLTRGTYIRQHQPPDLTGAGARRTRRALTYDAFVPAPLADVEVTFTAATAADIADAETALAQLNATAAQIAGFDALGRSLLRTEAVASSWIEALQVSHRKLAEAEHGAPGARYDEARRVVGNLRAMTSAIELGADDRPFTVDDLLSMHGMLLASSTLPTDRARAGQLRDEAVFIGGVTPQTAEYVGPPADHVPALLDDLVTFCNTRTDLSGVTQAALAHAQFETIHPFHDGNGRVGRCLIHTVLRRAATTDTIAAPISLILASRGGDYIDGLNAFRRDDVDGWTSIFATAVTQAAIAATEFGRSVQELTNRWRSQLDQRRQDADRKRVRGDAAVLQLLDQLAGMPVFQLNDVADKLAVTWKTAETAVAELVDADVVKPVNAGKRNRVFEATDLFDLVERFEQQAGHLER